MWTARKLCGSVQVALIVLTALYFNSLIPAGNATGGYDEYVTFDRTVSQDWNDPEIAAANGAAADNMAVTLQVFKKIYTLNAGGEDLVELSVLAFALDRDIELRQGSSYIIKELKISMKKMSIENDNQNQPDPYKWCGNYFINDHEASIDTQLWQNYNLSMQPRDDPAMWWLELVAAGASGGLGTIIKDVGLGIVYSIASKLAEDGLNLLAYRDSVYYDGESNPEEYEPAFYRGENDDPCRRGFLGSSDAALGGGLTWRLWDDCTMNHRLEIIAELTYAQLAIQSGQWFDEHTIKTSVSVSAVLGDGYGASYDYKTVGVTQYRGAAIDTDYDAPDAMTPYAPEIFQGKLYAYWTSPSGEMDPEAEQIEYSYSGYLTKDCDEHDWYRVFIMPNIHYSDNSVYIRLDVPEGADFDLTVYDLLSGTYTNRESRGSMTEEVIISFPTNPVDPAYYIGVNAFSGSGQYILTAYGVYQHYLGSNPGSGGCPHVAPWNGTHYVIDNNLLPAAQRSNGTDVEDFYKLQQSMVLHNGKNSFLIKEFEQEHSYIDRVRLIAVDHESDVNVGVSPYGEILTYKNPVAPISAIDEHARDLLYTVSTIGGDYYEGHQDSYLVMDFGDISIQNGAKLVLRSYDPEFAKSPIYIQTLNSTRYWQTVAVTYTRRYWSTDVIDLSDHLLCLNGKLKIKLLFVSADKVDYVGLDTSKQDDFEVHYANLVSAVHSQEGDMKKELIASDDIYAELIPGQQIEFEFTLPQNSEEARTYIIYVEGHYYTIP